MRILTFASLFPNSLDPTHGIFVYQRSAHLAGKRENEVIVVSPVPYFPKWFKTRRWRTVRDLPKREEIGGLTVMHPRYLLLPKISMPLHALLLFAGGLSTVARLHRKKRIDCIDAHFVYPDGMAAVFIGKYLGIPVVVSARGTDINVYPRFRTIRPMIRWTLDRADRVIAVSAALKEAMLKLGAPENRISVIPNGIDAQRFGYLDPSESRRRLNLPAEGSLLVSVGALIPSKGHDLLIRSLVRITECRPALHVYILGEGKQRLMLENLAKELGVQDKVHLIGKRPNEELRYWFGAAEASCLITEREGWPNVVTESLACGAPVIATRVGGIPEILCSSDLGVLTERTEEGVAQGIEVALTKKWDRIAISMHALARTWDTVASEVEAALVEGIQERALRQCK